MCAEFYRFPKDKECHCLWVAFIYRRNPDGSHWQPSTGDLMCSDHFIFRRKSDLPSFPDFVPSVQMKKLEIPGCSSCSKDSHCCFEHARCHARMQEQHSKELGKNRQANDI